MKPHALGAPQVGRRSPVGADDETPRSLRKYATSMVARTGGVGQGPRRAAFHRPVEQDGIAGQTFTRCIFPASQVLRWMAVPGSKPLRSGAAGQARGVEQNARITTRLSGR